MPGVLVDFDKESHYRLKALAYMSRRSLRAQVLFIVEQELARHPELRGPPKESDDAVPA